MAAKTVKEVMNDQVLKLSPEMTVEEAADFLLDAGISGAPVVDESGKAVGILTLADIAQAQAGRGDIARIPGQSDYYLQPFEEKISREESLGYQVKNEGILVQEAMTTALISVSEDTAISEVADLMFRSRVHRVLVLRGEKLLGIVSTMDLVKLLRDTQV